MCVQGEADQAEAVVLGRSLRATGPSRGSRSLNARDEDQLVFYCWQEVETLPSVAGKPPNSQAHPRSLASTRPPGPNPGPWTRPRPPDARERTLVQGEVPFFHLFHVIHLVEPPVRRRAPCSSLNTSSYVLPGPSMWPSASEDRRSEQTRRSPASFQGFVLQEELHFFVGQNRHVDEPNGPGSL